jgi:hypothetical protein
MKKAIYSILTMGIVFSLVLPVFAVSPNAKAIGRATVSPSASASPSPTITPSGSSTQSIQKGLDEYRSAKQDKKVEKLQAYGQRLIESRIEFIEKLISQTKASKQIPEDSKDELIADLEKNIDGLNELKTKIANETDLEQLKALVKSIFADYRIMAIVLPRNRAKLAVARSRLVLNKLDNLSIKIEKLISLAEKNNLDITQVQALLDDYEVKIAEAKKQLNLAFLKFSQMDPSNTQQAKTLLAEGKAALKAAKAALEAAKKDLKQITATLRLQFKYGYSSGTGYSSGIGYWGSGYSDTGYDD